MLGDHRLLLHRSGCRKGVVLSEGQFWLPLRFFISMYCNEKAVVGFDFLCAAFVDFGQIDIFCSSLGSILHCPISSAGVVINTENNHIRMVDYGMISDLMG